MKVKLINTEGRILGLEKSDAILLEKYCYHRDMAFSLVGITQLEPKEDIDFHRKMMLDLLRQLLVWEIIKSNIDLHTTWKIM